MPWRPALLCLALLLVQLGGCATVATVPQEAASQACRDLFAQVDAAVDAAGVRDQGPAPVAGFPYLRVNRFLASFRGEVDTPERFQAWSTYLAALDHQARAIELANLDRPLAGLAPAALGERLDGCRERLLREELARPQRRAALEAAAQVPDDYVSWWRLAGLYPLTAPLVSLGIGRWHDDAAALFATPLTELPVNGTLTRWSTPRPPPLEREAVRRLLGGATDPLGLPLLQPAELDRLFATFAPVWEVDVAADDDRIGAPAWHSGPVVDTTRPSLYRLVSHTRFAGRVLLQLNYIVWFPARSGDDIYSGRLDGIDWRVTLGPDGEPWLYDAIHNCGCYHEFFPSDHLRLRPDLPWFYFEAPLLPQPAPTSLPLVLRIAHRTHYIERVYAAPAEAPFTALQWRDYDTLRALPDADGGRSLFGAYGIVSGSERTERYLLWPMGIRSPGAMRQWGRHAVAFVGRRHFDEAHLLDGLFEPVTPP